jgi:hypothetical protein
MLVAVLSDSARDFSSDMLRLLKAINSFARGMQADKLGKNMNQSC